MSILHIVLYQPEIPQNTGNIGRTCVALGAKLWIVRPTGFRMDSAHLRRAGMDYWQHLNWESVDNWLELRGKLGGRRLWLVTKFAKSVYTEVEYSRDDVLVFGRETNGLPPEIRSENCQHQVRIPMSPVARSLNLATSAAIVIYEAARQIGFSQFVDMEQQA